jgi:hypothetical protein
MWPSSKYFIVLVIVRQSFPMFYPTPQGISQLPITNQKGHHEKSRAYTMHTHRLAVLMQRAGHHSAGRGNSCFMGTMANSCYIMISFSEANYIPVIVYKIC